MSTSKSHQAEKGSTFQHMKEKVADLAHGAAETTKGAVQSGTAFLKGQFGSKDTSTTLQSDVQGQKSLETKSSNLGGYTSGIGSRTNRGVVFKSDNKVEIRSIPFPEMKLPWNGQPVNHGCIVKVLTTGICGTDLHPFHGRAGMKEGTVLGHEIVGEVVEVGAGVQHVKVGDWGAIGATIACGTCSSCKTLRTEACINTNPNRDEAGQGGLFGFVGTGDWQGGQAEYVFVPYCDYNFFQFPDKAKARAKLLDLTLLTDVAITGFHGTEEARVKVGSTVFIAGAGPVGLSAAAICNLKGASCVIISDTNPERLELAKLQGCYTININEVSDEKSLMAKIKEFTGTDFVDCAIDCVGYEARGLGSKKDNVTCCALDNCIQVCKPAGYIGVLGVYPPMDPKAPTEAGKSGHNTIALGKAWGKGLTLTTGPLSIWKYIEQVYRMIMADKLPLARLLNVTAIPLDKAPDAYLEFSKRAAKKFVIDPHGILQTCEGCGMTSCDKSGCTDRTKFSALVNKGNLGTIDKSLCTNKECTKDANCLGANCGNNPTSSSLPTFSQSDTLSM